MLKVLSTGLLGLAFLAGCNGTGKIGQSSSAGITVSNASSSSGIDTSLVRNGPPIIPESSNPNDETLKYILYKYLYYGTNIGDRYHLVKSSNPYSFTFNLRDDKYIKRQMQ